MTSTLLDGGSSPTLWVDREGFNSGRLASYLEVWANACMRNMIPACACTQVLLNCGRSCKGLCVA